MATSFTVYNDESLNNLNANSINATALVVGSLFAQSLAGLNNQLTLGLLLQPPQIKL